MQMAIKLCHQSEPMLWFSITVSFYLQPLNHSINLFPSKSDFNTNIQATNTFSIHKHIFTLVRFCARFQISSLLLFVSLSLHQFKYEQNRLQSQRIKQAKPF